MSMHGYRAKCNQNEKFFSMKHKNRFFYCSFFRLLPSAHTKKCVCVSRAIPINFFRYWVIYLERIKELLLNAHYNIYFCVLSQITLADRYWLCFHTLYFFKLISICSLAIYGLMENKFNETGTASIEIYSGNEGLW